MMRILIPLDGSVAAEAALKHAVSIAMAFPAEIILLRVIAEPDSGASIREDSVDLALWRHQAQTYLNGLRDQYTTDDVSIRCEVAEGSAAKAIVDAMATSKPDLMVLTRFGRGDAQDFAAGGTAQKIVASANCSVLLLDPYHPYDPVDGYRRILVPIDDGKESDCAVAIASMLAEIHGASLLLLQVTEEPQLPASLPKTRHARTLITELLRVIRHEAERRLRELANKTPANISVETRVLPSPDTALAIEATADANDSDLILLHTTTAVSDIGRGFGPVNQSLIQFSHRPLFLLRPSAAEGFASNFRSVYLDEPRLEAG